MEKGGKMPARLAIPSRKQVSRYHDYDPATDTEPGTPEHETFLRERQSRILKLWKICVLFLCLLIGLLLGFLSCSPSELSSLIRGPTRHCGNSATDAVKLGCAFDLLSHSWAPRGCLERKTNEEFRDWAWSHERKRRKFPYFRDSSGKDWLVHEEQMARRSGDVWTTEEVELGRCVFLGKRASRMKGEAKSGMEEMMEECKKMQLEDLVGIRKSRSRDLGKLTVKFQVDFGSC